MASIWNRAEELLGASQENAMRNHCPAWFLPVIVGVCLSAGVVARSEPAVPSKSADKPAKAAPAPRLPPYFAQIGLSNAQRAKVLKVRQDYAARIERLEQELANLVAQRDGEVEGVLTDEQKKKLAALRAAPKTKEKAKDAKPPEAKAAKPTGE
jgi:hypothetical protein